MAVKFWTSYLISVPYLVNEDNFSLYCVVVRIKYPLGFKHYQRREAHEEVLAIMKMTKNDWC